MDDDKENTSPTGARIEENEDRNCRVCRDAEPLAELISPCGCRGTMKWVHRHCWERSNRRCLPCNTNPPPNLRDQIAAALERELQDLNVPTDEPLHFSVQHYDDDDDYDDYDDYDDEDDFGSNQTLTGALTSTLPVMMSMVRTVMNDGNVARQRQLDRLQQLERILVSKPMIAFGILCITTACVCMLSMTLVAIRLGYNAVFM